MYLFILSQYTSSVSTCILFCTAHKAIPKLLSYSYLVKVMCIPTFIHTIRVHQSLTKSLMQNYETCSIKNKRMRSFKIFFALIVHRPWHLDNDFNQTQSTKYLTVLHRYLETVSIKMLINCKECRQGYIHICITTPKFIFLIN